MSDPVGPSFVRECECVCVVIITQSLGKLLMSVPVVLDIRAVGSHESLREIIVVFSKQRIVNKEGGETT